jgi:hypothetical protein
MNHRAMATEMNQQNQRTRTTGDIKIKFSIEIKQDYNRTTEATALPPSFDYWDENIVLDSLSIN